MELQKSGGWSISGSHPHEAEDTTQGKRRTLMGYIINQLKEGKVYADFCKSIELVEDCLLRKKHLTDIEHKR